MRKKVEISFIIVHYKVKEELFTCINSIKKTVKNIPYEVIVVDNDEEKTIEQDLKKKYPHVAYIKNNNTGWGGGTNVGVHRASGRYLYFLNPDTRLYPDAVNKQYEFIKSHENAGVVSSMLVDNSGKPYPYMGTAALTPLYGIFSYSFLNKLFPNNPISRAFWLKDWHQHSVRETAAVPLSASLMRKEDFQKVGGFDEKMFMYFEEYDLSNKLRKIGRENFILPDAKVYHAWGVSSRERKDIPDIFVRSRFYYFLKYFGWRKAIFTEAFLRVSLTHILLLFFVALALFLRLYRLSELMPFIGDQGWFYLSARDMLITGHIPLVGITSSHTWLHQGPLWTYILSIIFFLTRFNPLVPGYVTATIDALAVVLIYIITKELFSKRTGIIAAFLYTISPLAILYSRMPYHTSFIGIFSILLLFVVKKVTDDWRMMPFIFLLMGILYNFELVTQVFWLPVLVLFIYQFYKKRKSKRIHLRDVILSLVGFVLPMFPVFIYDWSHGFKQTIVFAGWTIFHGVLSFFGKTQGEAGSQVNMFSFFASGIQRLLFLPSELVAGIFFLGGTALFIRRLYKKRQGSYVLLALFFFSTIGLLFLNKTPSEAYLPMILPYGIILMSVAINDLLTSKKTLIIMLLLIFVIGIVNIRFLLAHNYFIGKNEIGYSFRDRLMVAKEITYDAQGLPLSLTGSGPGSNFPSFTMNYEYLIWYLKGNIVTENPLIRYTIYEKPSGIFFDKIKPGLAMYENERN